ncbi:MAG: CaiB/BaiF CoA transferase family protein [Hyphomicrobiaceae bacterium]
MADNTVALNCLNGVRVLDLSQFEAGPSCTEALAWLGAEVVKVENPKLGDPGRAAVFGSPDKDSHYFLIFNANKKSITVDLKTAEGKKLVLDLAAKADVMVENFAPGAIERLGLGYDVVAKINPGIIYAQVKGFGEGSPFESGLAFDMIAQAAGGVMSISGYPDGPPAKPGNTLGDTGTGMLLAVSILGSLYEKSRTGKGQRLQVAMQDAMLHYIRIAFSTQARTGVAAGRAGAKTLSGANPPVGIYPCKGGGPNDYCYIYTSRANPDHWKRLCGLIGRPELADDPRYATVEARTPREAEIDEMISVWTRTLPKVEVMQRVSAAGVPSGAVMDTMELHNDVTFERRGIMQTMEHAKVGPFKMPAWPVRHNGKPPQVKPSPLLGENTGDVLHSWLGLDDKAVAALKAKKIAG